MVELNLINPEHPKRTRMEHNDSHKFESQFLGVTVPENNSVMFGPLSGMKTGIWVAHGEGKFVLPMPLENYNVVARYSYASPRKSDIPVAVWLLSRRATVGRSDALDRCLRQCAQVD